MEDEEGGGGGGGGGLQEGTATGQGGGSAIVSHYARWNKHIAKGTTQKPEKKELETNIKTLN